MADQGPERALEQALKPSWLETASQAGLPRPNAEAFFRGLCRLYGGPDRAYHNLGHVAAMLGIVSELEGLLFEPVEVRLAVWFHDYIYDARRGDNEEESAAYMNIVLDHESCSLLRPRLAELILATKTHRARWGDTDCQVLLDADLAILGADAPEYDRYARAIRAEYAWAPDGDYRAGRRRVLEGFLGRGRLYHTDAMFQSREAAARANLAREIESLERGEFL